MMTQVYKIPQEITKDQMLALIGDEGSLLNPINDKEGNLIISQEEWDAREFQKYKEIYFDLIGGFELIDYVPQEITPTK